MNSKIIKAVTALLAFSMVMPLASCGKKKGGASGKKTISDDTPWFDTALYDVDQGLNQEREIEYVYSDYVGSDENNIIVLTSGNYKIPDKIDWETYNYSDYAISVLTIVDRATKKTVRTIDLSTKLKDSDYDENARYSDGKITVIYTSIEGYRYCHRRNHGYARPRKNGHLPEDFQIRGLYGGFGNGLEFEPVLCHPQCYLTRRQQKEDRDQGRAQQHL